jgi:DNA-binding transcriptional LysR family regulator
MDVSWEDLKLFLAVAETGSVTAAARHLGIGQPTVSRRIAGLEYSLGAALFRRSVGGTSLTSAGERLLIPARRMAEWAGELGRTADAAANSPSGVVRVTAAHGLAADFVAPFASWLTEKHPRLRLEVLSALHSLDLGRGEADLALRIGGTEQQELKIIQALEFQSGGYVAKSLAARLPSQPHFATLPWIAWAPPYDRIPPNPMLKAQIPGFTPAFASDNFLVNMAAAESGVGAIILPRLRHRFSRPSNLVRLPIDLGPQAQGSLRLICARSAYDIPRVRVVADLLAAELAGAVQT